MWLLHYLLADVNLKYVLTLGQRQCQSQDSKENEEKGKVNKSKSRFRDLEGQGGRNNYVSIVWILGDLMREYTSNQIINLSPILG